MKDLSKILETTPIKPKVWEHDPRILRRKAGLAKTLQPYSQEEKFLIFKKKILVSIPKKNVQKKKNPLDSSVTNRKEDIEDNISVMWLVKDIEDKILGPYTSLEIREMIQREELGGKHIKRDYDKEFVEYNKIKKEVEDILDNNEFEKYLEKVTRKNLNLESENNCTGGKSEDDKYDINLKNVSNRFSLLFVSDEFKRNRDLLAVEKPSVNRKLDLRKNKFEVSFSTVSYPKTNKFLISRNIKTTVETIVDKIYGKSRASAMNIVCFLTSLSKEDCEMVINLLSSESSKEVLSDNNSDGFVKVLRKQSKK